MEGIGLDFVAGPGNRETLAQAGGIGGKTLVTGVVDGRNVWRSDLRGALSACASLLGLAGALVVSTSCSLLHVPLDVRSETTLPPELAGRLAFARQKVDEVVTLGRAPSQGRDGITAELAATAPPPPPMNGRMRARLDALGDGPPAAVTPSAAPPGPAACRCCPRSRSGRSRRPSRSARRAPTTRAHR